MAWKVIKELPAPYSEVITKGMVFMDDKIPVIKEFKVTHFLEVTKVDYMNAILPKIYDFPPGDIRDHYINSLLEAINFRIGE